jgi:hypothetical protein
MINAILVKHMVLCDLMIKGGGHCNGCLPVRCLCGCGIPMVEVMTIAMEVSLVVVDEDVVTMCCFEFKGYRLVIMMCTRRQPRLELKKR